MASVLRNGEGWEVSSPRWATLEEDPGFGEDEVRPGLVAYDVYVELIRGGGEGHVDLGARRATWGTAKDLGIAGE